MDPTVDALRAALASGTGQQTEAHRHLDAARRHSQTSARRHRQVVEIAGLIVSGARERAEGLALVHVAEFPDDAELLAQMVGQRQT
jgi:hypothetical protein